MTVLLALLPPFLETTAGDGFEAIGVLLEAGDDDEISMRFTDDDDDDELWEVKEEEKLRRNKSEVWRKAAAVRI